MTPRNGSYGGPRDWVLVGGAWLALALVLSVWLAIDRRPPASESARELERAVQCSEDLGAARATTVVARTAWEAPIVPCFAGAVYRLYRSDVAAGQAVIFLALGLGMAATYLLARDLGGAVAAVPAAWLFGAAPLVVHSALRFQVDIPVAATVAVALLALSRTDRFTRTPMSLVAGGVFALGMLLTPAFGLYVVGPVAWLLAVSRSWRAIVNVLLVLLVTFATTVPWYGPRVLLRMPAAPEPFRATASQYAAGLVQQLGVLAVVLVLVGLVVAAVHGRGFAIVAFVVPLAIVALARTDRSHETLPLVPAAAVLGGMTVGALPGRARLAALVTVGLVGAVQVSAVAWGVPPATALPVLHTPWVVESPPSGGDWRHRDVLRAIASDSGGRPVTVSVLADHAAFSAANFRYYARRDGLAFRVVSAWERAPIGIDYVIAKSGDVGVLPAAEASRRAMAELGRDAALARVYPVVADFPLPDGSTASVRARRVPEGVSVPPEALATALETALGRQLGAVGREVDNLALRVEHDAEITRGRVKRIELTSDSAVLADDRRPDAARLRVRRLALVADDVLVNPFALETDGRAALLDVGRLRVARAEISGDDAQAFLGQLRSLRRTRIRLATGAVYVTARRPGADVSALIRVVPAADRRLTLHVERASIGWVPLPASLVNWVVRDYDPVDRLTSGLPFPVELAPVVVTDQAVRIGE
jgi:hypothetical protein